MIRFLFCLVAPFCCGLLFASLPSMAQQTGDVAVGGDYLFKIRAAAQGKSPQERADDVTDRLAVILGDDTLTSRDVSIVSDKSDTLKIMVKQYLLITVTPQDGKPNQKTAREQAEIWAEAARRLLPEVNAMPNQKAIDQAPQSVSGTVSYLQRIALPNNSLLIVQLVDVSRADAPAVKVAAQRIRTTTQVPIHFKIKYTPAKIDPRHTYAIEARISIKGTLRWINAQRYNVITHGNPREVNIRLKQITAQE